MKHVTWLECAHNRNHEITGSSYFANQKEIFGA